MKSPQNLKILISEEEIKTKVKELADQIYRDFQGKNPLLLGVLQGAFIFLADLVRQIEMDLEINFIEVSSYGSDTESSGEVKIEKDIEETIEERHLIIVEDIIDTGITMNFLVDYLNQRNPVSINICTLTSKPARREKDIEIDYLGFKVPNKFLVGYGLDFNERYRNLPAIYYLDKQ
ncbi:MAG: hypoxanthine phosphoribosyltransferase [Promethearchaeia archaeon]